MADRRLHILWLLPLLLALLAACSDLVPSGSDTADQATSAQRFLPAPEGYIRNDSASLTDALATLGGGASAAQRQPGPGGRHQHHRWYDPVLSGCGRGRRRHLHQTFAGHPAAGRGGQPGRARGHQPGTAPAATSSTAPWATRHSSPPRRRHCRSAAARARCSSPTRPSTTSTQRPTPCSASPFRATSTHCSPGRAGGAQQAGWLMSQRSKLSSIYSGAAMRARASYHSCAQARASRSSLAGLLRLRATKPGNMSRPVA